MKKLILLILASIFIEVNAQTRPANIEVQITMWDNSGMPNNPRVLTCGIDSMATDSIDSFLGEYWLFCPYSIDGSNSDCPPIDHFEALFDIPTDPPPGTFLYGSWKDIRHGMIPYSGIKTYSIEYEYYSTATAIYISWNFPDGVTGLLKDVIGGTILNYQMPDSGTFTHPYFMMIPEVYLILTFQGVIPVELTSFTASVLQNEKAVRSDWTTATETNNSGFEIQRTSPLPSPYQGEGVPTGRDGRGWEIIGFVPGFGTTTEPKSYSFIDENVTSEMYKYRLKQIDFDGTFTYSNEIEVEVDFTPKEFVLYQNYPNPFNPSTTIKFEIPDVETTRRVVFTTLKVYDVLGNEVATLVNEEKQPSTYEVEFGLESGTRNLASGIYFYQIKVGSFTDTKKMILLR